MARTSRKQQQNTEISLMADTAIIKYNAAAYTRLSLEDNNVQNGNSMEAQKELLINFISEQDDMQLYSVYCDNGFTGTNFDRDDFQRMMDDIKSGKVNCVIVKDLSRFARNYIEAGTYIEKIFPFMGVRFISVNDGYDSNKNDVTDIMVTMRNIINDAYVKDISRKIKTMFVTKQTNGDFIGWSAPYGYLKAEDNNNRLIIDPITAPVVTQIYGWKADGLGFLAIARKLNEMGIPSPRMRNIENGRYKNAPNNGKFWTDASVSLIIKNPVYMGHMAQRKYTRTSVNGQQKQLDKSDWVIVQNTHEPIISDELWNAVQAITKKNADSWGVNKRKKDKPSNDGDNGNILRGLLICPYCKKVMQRRVDRNSGHTYHYCNMRRANPDCKTKLIREDALFATIFEAVTNKIRAAADVKKSLEKMANSKNHIDAIDGMRKKIADTNTKLKRAVTLKSQLIDAYGDNLITEQEFKDMKAGYIEKIGQLESEATQLEKEYKRLTVAFSADNDKIAAFVRHKDNKCLTREMVVQLVEKIIVHDSQKIEIIWKFNEEYETAYAYSKTEGGGM